MNLSTRYIGLELRNPLIVSSSPLSRDLDTARRLEDAGAAALVMYSLFEEEVTQEREILDHLTYHQDIGHGEAGSYLPINPDYKTGLDEYLEQLSGLKAALSIPVIASLNGTSVGGWIEHGRELQDAGADALELNVYYLAADVEESSEAVESRYTDILNHLQGQVSIPITMKLPFQFSSIGHFAKRLERAGADGIVLFNRFYLPDIDLEDLKVIQSLQLSSSADALIAMRWIGMLYGRVKLSIAATGGIHTAADVLKMLLAGADATYLCSALLQHGPQHLEQILQDMAAWLNAHDYDSVEQLKGSVSQQHAPDPGAFERANYVKLLNCYDLPPERRA